ncbi:DUF58 domain-containing protein [Metabacillus sp. GX 13764]|uniref:DUF58 domain-containing protein n=1 Tax=Metabacillus kandeliae TaxID=2900151 RepID=UPI001E2A99BA|nr:DUF58 domain-containing protein [Metabacillus kandeliae]MCD7036484.1 DUF58 domain-containing protein [Metabacillus kandeliae]
MRKILGRINYAWKLVSLLLLTAAVFVYAMFQGGFVSWFLFYAFLPFAGYTLLLALYPISTFHVSRSISQEQFTAGQALHGEITIKRRVPFPLIYLIAEDCLPEGIRKKNPPGTAKKLLFPWFKRSMTFTYAIPSIPRGEHQFDRIRIKTGDFFGLFEKEVTFSQSKDFLVYPSIIQILYKSPVRRYEQGNTHSSQRLIKDTTMAAGIREYQPGDRVSWIDWKSTARRNTMMTKEFEQTRSHDVYLFMDRTNSHVFEQIVVFTASAANAVLKSGAHAGLVSFGKEIAFFPLQAGNNQLLQISSHLARADCDSDTPFSEVIERGIEEHEGKKALRMLITGEVSLELVRKLEQKESPLTSSLYLIKEKGAALANEEKVLLERLNKRGISASAVFEGNFESAFKGGRSS